MRNHSFSSLAVDTSKRRKRMNSRENISVTGREWIVFQFFALLLFHMKIIDAAVNQNVEVFQLKFLICILFFESSSLNSILDVFSERLL
jgi:hypothetical protein